MKNVIIYFSVFFLYLFVGLSPVYAGWKEGIAAYDRGDYETAFQEFKPLAERGHAGAQNNIGFMYKYGTGVPEDYAEALKWFRKAAERGLATAQFSLGLMYYDGTGVPKDYAEAVKWYKKTAEQGYAGGQRNLGAMYNMGLGVTRDNVMAHMWLNLAAAQGDEGAITYKSILEKEMTPEQIAEAQRLSREFKMKSPQAMRPSGLPSN